MDKETSKKVAMLKKCKSDYEAHLNDCETVIFQWSNGTKSGIGNPEMKKMLLQTCIDEAQRQIDILEGREPKKFRVVVINDDHAARIYEEEGIKALNEYCQDSYVSSIEKEFDSEELMQAYLDGMCDIAGGDERAPANYLVITDVDEINKLEI